MCGKLFSSQTGLAREQALFLLGFSVSVLFLLAKDPAGNLPRSVPESVT